MIYYCKKCKTLTNETDIIPGKTYDVDAYKNSSCPECGSENIIELEADALCPTCGDYHEDDYDYKDCADKLFYDMYIISYLSYFDELRAFVDEDKYKYDNRSISQIFKEQIHEQKDWQDYRGLVEYFEIYECM